MRAPMLEAKPELHFMDCLLIHLLGFGANCVSILSTIGISGGHASAIRA
jgi:hypothetical protein